jgi:hypothetical protein
MSDNIISMRAFRVTGRVVEEKSRVDDGSIRTKIHLGYRFEPENDVSSQVDGNESAPRVDNFFAETNEQFVLEDSLVFENTNEGEFIFDGSEQIAEYEYNDFENTPTFSPAESFHRLDAVEIGSATFSPDVTIRIREDDIDSSSPSYIPITGTELGLGQDDIDSSSPTYIPNTGTVLGLREYDIDSSSPTCIPPKNSNNQSFDDQDEKFKCKICYSEDITHCLVPCGHTLCEFCINRIDIVTCPFCRASIFCELKLFH